MRFERLVIESDDHTFTLELHPRLTVIAGVGHLERDGLVSELIGALGSSRAGVHAEILTDSGARFALFRPTGGRHRLVSIDPPLDVSDRFRTSDGEIDLLARAGLDTRTAKRTMRLTGTELATASQTDHLTQQLARIDPLDLWPAAERVRLTEDNLQAEAEAVGSQPEDAEVVHRIEARHHELERAQQRHERYRRLSFFAGVFAALIAVPMAMAAGTVAALPPLIAATAITAMSFLEFRRMERAAREEAAALRDAGAHSYLGFHLQRVNGMLASDQHRRRLMGAGEDHREALATWRALAGEVEVDWALEHRVAIDDARRRQLLAGGGHDRPADSLEGAASSLSEAMVDRLELVATLGPGGESFPLILDEPFQSVRTSQKAPLLELLVQASVHQQLILLTEDEDVAAWARVEALTGDLLVLEPAEHVETRRAQAAQPQPHQAA